ncbi:MAG: DUF308 domain-containing protein [Rikenella sp.]|nr:DUF308 domain-containing protein [Rikenella sp.]
MKMEKYAKNRLPLLIGVIAMVVGLVMMIWSARILKWGVKLIGVVAIVIGLIQFAGFMIRTKGRADRWKYLPVAAPIAVIWGGLLLLTPELWTSLFMILFGVLLIFLGLYQLVAMYKTKKSGINVPGIYFFFSILLMIAGIFASVQPVFMQTWFMTFIGAWILAYGVIEVFGYFTLRKPIDEPNETGAETTIQEKTNNTLKNE